LIGSSDLDEIFFEMQVISVAFRLSMFGIEEMETELLGMPGREVWWNFSGFF
jgi:hypothetical protein